MFLCCFVPWHRVSFLVFDIVLCSCCWCVVLWSCSLFLLLCLVCLCSLSLILSLVRKNQMKTTSTNVEQRTRTIIIKNDTNETPHHQRKNQEIKAKNTFGNNGYRTNNIKTRTTLNVFWLFAVSFIIVLFLDIVFLFWCLILFVVLVVGALSFVLARCFYCCVWFACVLCLGSCLCSKKSNEKQRARIWNKEQEQ